jgi:hypothetical protein
MGIGSKIYPHSSCERDGKFYWYVAVKHKSIPGRAIGVAVADRPEGPFHDARGSALIGNDMTTFIKSDKDDIDPTVMIDDDGQAWLFWGNGICYYAKLKRDMIGLDGPIRTVPLPGFSEGAWIHNQRSSISKDSLIWFTTMAACPVAAITGAPSASTTSITIRMAQ